LGHCWVVDVAREALGFTGVKSALDVLSDGEAERSGHGRVDSSSAGR